jgi:hypothetical protein
MYITLATEPARSDRPNEAFVATTLDTLVVLDGVGTAGTKSGCIHGTPGSSSSWAALFSRC